VYLLSRPARVDLTDRGWRCLALAALRWRGVHGLCSSWFREVAVPQEFGLDPAAGILRQQCRFSVPDTVLLVPSQDLSQQQLLPPVACAVTAHEQVYADADTLVKRQFAIQ